MPLNLDSYLGTHTQALMLEAQRTQVLAANLANVDTPGYKARDIDFKAAMAAASGDASSQPLPLTPAGGSLSPGGLLAPGATPSAATAGHPATATAGPATEAPLQYRTPLAPSLDGNTVDEQLEQAAFAENGVRYQATLTFLNSQLRSLMTAITGQ